MIAPRRAFTLIEIIIAGVITAILAAALFAFLADLQLRQRNIAEQLAATRAASSLFDHIETAARTSVATAPDGTQGFRGQPDTLTITYRAHSGHDQPHRTLRITTTNPGVRLETTSSTERAPTQHQSTAIHRVQFDYFNGQDWSPAHNPATDAFPRAVRIKLWFNPPPQEEQAASNSSTDFSPIPEGAFDDSPPDESDDEPPPDRVRVIYIPGPSL